MTQDCTLARWAAALALAGTFACSGGDDGDDDGAPLLDAGAGQVDAFLGDAAVVDCTGDHRESEDGSNNPFGADNQNGTAEGTGLSLAAGSRAGFTICGQIDPRQATDLVADYDAFEFTVDGEAPVNLRIELVAASGAYDQLGLHLFRVQDGLPVPLATGPYRNGYALIAGKVVDPGTYWVGALGWPPAPDGPIGYAISVVENRLSCPRAEAAPTYMEIHDGLDNRGNDTVAVGRPPVLTAAETDAPEETNLTLEPDEVRLVAGTSAVVTDVPEDSYLDRDAYALATGPSTTELELRLSWDDGDVDLDLYLFEAGRPDHDYSVALGTSPGGNLDEVLTLNVDPGRSYWLWVAAFDDTMQGGATDLPRDYGVTLCPREHAPALPASR